MRIRELLEALGTRKKAAKGEIPFKKSTLTDPHVMQVINDLSKRTGVPVPDIVKDLEPEMAKYTILKHYSPMLYNTIIDNAAETVVFDLIQRSRKLATAKLDLEDVRFDPRVFRQLITMIQRENSALFPIRPKGEFKPLFKISPIIVPTSLPRYAKFNYITTAAASPNGEFIFNKDFMQNLLYYGEAVGLKPKDAKYQCNGGPVPDAYAYIEFLIMHELLHYRFGDGSTGLQYKKYGHLENNWAMDFRINYILAKNGYEQLPMGLFSDDLNFDRPETSNYRKLIQLVHAEMKKLPSHIKGWLEGELITDDHVDKGSEDDPKGPKPKIKPPEVNPGDIVVQKVSGYPKKVIFVRVHKVYEDGTADVEEVDAETRSKIIEKLKKAGKLK